jgi:hypothetical protein
VRLRTYLVSAFCLLTSAFAANARVTRVEIDSRKDVDHGRYERITGRLFFALDPRNAHNSVIVDLDKAERNAAGDVEFSSDFYIVRPKAGGNEVMLFEVANRGDSSFVIDSEPDDRFFFQRGYTMAVVGWQFDAVRSPAHVRLQAPLARGVRGRVRSDFVVQEKMDEYPVSHVIPGNVIGGIGYAVDDLAAPDAALSERETQSGRRRIVPRKLWRFVNPTTLHRDGGFLPGRIYEVIYPSKDPAVVGTGLAAMRDFVSWCKHDPASAAQVKFAYGFGISQSGRVLRHFVWQGFNADEEGRQVFDGILSHVAGAGRGNFNHRFAQPSRDVQPLAPAQYPIDVFPFTDMAQTDPVTGQRAGLLDRASADHVVPKIFYTNTATEYWSRGAALAHTTPDGKADAELPPTSRVYFLPGLAHVAGPFPPALGTVGERRGTLLRNPNQYWNVTHALFDAMDAWVRRGVEPPPSRIPRIADGTLVAREKLPAVDAVPFPQPYAPERIDFGPGFATGIMREPPVVNGSWPVLVPQVDRDGNELAGVRDPFLDVPLATYTGWNLRTEATGFPGIRTSYTGAYIPWTKDKVLARYGNRTRYLGLFAEAAMRMMTERFLLPEDLPELLESGVRRWDYATR